jgi:hypothetical protein
MQNLHKYRRVPEGPFRHAERLANGDLILRFRTPEGTWGSIVKSGNGAPAREVRPGWQQRPTYRLSSKKVVGAGAAESGLEVDTYQMFDLDPTVVSYETQPFVVNYEGGSRKISTYPDAERKLSDGRFEIVQIKTQQTYQKHLRENPRFRDEGEIFRRLGWSYRVMTELDVRSEPDYQNRKLLHHYRRQVISTSITSAVLAAIRRNPHETIKSLTATLKSEKLHAADLYALIAQRLIHADLSVPIGPDTRLMTPT